MTPSWAEERQVSETASPPALAGLLAGPFGLSTTVLAGGTLTSASGLLAARWIGGNRSGATGPGQGGGS